jgi:hypothetical protein
MIDRTQSSKTGRPNEWRSGTGRPNEWRAGR